jgi:glucan phosphoethanolaminetransferase (alkaline phosphatase superfamily)
MSENSQITEALIRQARKRNQKRPVRFRFRLSTMLLVVTAVCVLSAVAHYLGYAYVEEVIERTQYNNRGAAMMPALEFLSIPMFVCGLLLGTIVVWLVSRLSEQRAFWFFAFVSIVSLFLLIVALNLPGKSLTETKTSGLKPIHFVKVSLLLIGSVAPIGALIGWRCAEGTERRV